MTREGLTELDKMFEEDAKLIIKHALDQGVPAEWYFHHLQGHVIKWTEKLYSDIDFLLSKGEVSNKWYDKHIIEFERRKKIFGKEKSKIDTDEIDEVLSLVEKGIEHCADRSHCLHVLYLARTVDGRAELEKEIKKG